MSRLLTGYLGPGTHWKGDLTFEGRLRVDGEFAGRIFSDDLLEVGAGGRVEGQVDVSELVVAGVVDGDIQVRGLLRVESTGIIKGELKVLRMEAASGSQIKAKVERLKATP